MNQKIYISILVFAFTLFVAHPSSASGQDKIQKVTPDAPPKTNPTSDEKKQDDAWATVAPEGTGISLRMPKEPKVSKRNISPVADKTTTVHLHICNLSPSNSFVFAYNKLTDEPSTPQQIKETLDGAVKGAVARTLGDIIAMSNIKINGMPGREFTFKCIQGEKETVFKLKVMARAILVADTMYQLTYVAAEDEFSDEDARKFLDSVAYTAPPATDSNDESESKPTDIETPAAEKDKIP